MKGSPFTKLPDDVVLRVFFKLEDDPRNWARLACVSPKFSTLICTVWRSRCLSIMPSVVADLSRPSPAGDHFPGGWSALHKIAVCCPGLLDAGVLLDNSDFGLDRELGTDQIYCHHHHTSTAGDPRLCSSDVRDDPTIRYSEHAVTAPAVNSWSLYDDLYLDTVCDNSDSHPPDYAAAEGSTPTVSDRNCSSGSKKRRIQRPVRSHLASGTWSLSREQGNKLLASRFRDDALYICDWPGCIHAEARRSYMLLRGVFKNFKRSRVWRTINDGQRSRIGLNCAYCSCNRTWDLQSAFCLRRAFGYHDDGEPVVRAYVCENGHVSGAWTHLPLYT